MATLAALQGLGEHWIDFHGPSEPRRLLKDSCQLELLDLFGRAAQRDGGVRSAGEQSGGGEYANTGEADIAQQAAAIELHDVIPPDALISRVLCRRAMSNMLR